ncbi:MAG: CPXCG motif-containing cysteine-rich protein [Lysobacterales bacterium]
MTDLLEHTIGCPYCGEAITIFADPSVPEQEYVEDCQVCCQPIVLRVTVTMQGEAMVESRRENE